MRFSSYGVMLLSAVCLASTGMAQDASPEGNPSVERLRLQLEFQTQRVKILKDRLQLMKSLQQTELEQARLQVDVRDLETDHLTADIQQSEANRLMLKQHYEYAKRLRDKGFTSQAEFEIAKLKMDQGEAEHRKVVAEAEHKKQVAAGPNLQLKRLELQGAIQVNEMELEILEAEHEIQLTRLELKNRAE